MKLFVAITIGASLIVAACGSTSNEAEPAKKTTCTIDGVTFPAGPATFPCPDGCNTCKCFSDGTYETTLVACGKEQDAGVEAAVPDAAVDGDQ